MFGRHPIELRELVVIDLQPVPRALKDRHEAGGIICLLGLTDLGLAVMTRRVGDAEYVLVGNDPDLVVIAE